MFDCINYGGIWTNPPANFDNTLNAMELMYTMGQVNWVKHMWIAVDSVGPLQ